MIKGKFSVDYYITEKSTSISDYGEYNIIDKVKFSVISSIGKLDDDFDVFIKKTDFVTGKTPSINDLAFFINDLKFYSVKECQDAGDFYIINIAKYQIKR